MATASVSITPECCICYESFKIPKFLPCGHTFCLGCIERCISDKAKTFPCPVCQQEVQIPEGGAKSFATNYILQTSKETTQVRDQPSSTTQPKCPNHNQREVDYYCNNCNIGLCAKCMLGQHKEHETLDIECDETRNKAIEKLERSQNIIQNRIKNLKKTRCSLLESFGALESLCEDSCTKVTEKTEQIISDLRKRCEQITDDIRNNLEENRRKVEDREMEITCEISVLEGNTESKISPSTKTTLNILQTLPRLLEIEKQTRIGKNSNLCLQQLQWENDDDDNEEEEDDEDDDEDDDDEKMKLILDCLGSVKLKPFDLQGLCEFLFDVNVIEKIGSVYYNNDKFSNNNLVWSCGVRIHNGGFHIYIKLLPDDFHILNYCIVDYQISLLNIDDESETLTRTITDKKLKKGAVWSWFWRALPWSKFNDKNNGFVNSCGQFTIQFEITDIRKIEFSQ